MASTNATAEKEGKGVKVLAVEDNPGDYRLIKDMLQDARFGFYHIQNSDRMSKTIDVLENETFDLILLDLNIIDSKGLTTFKTLHHRFPKIPIVVLTGGLDEDLAMKAIEGGAQDYLFKNELSPRTLGRAVLYAIERKRTEEVIKASEARFRSLYENSLDAILLARPDGTILSANPAAQRMFGMTEEEIRKEGRAGTTIMDDKLRNALLERERTRRSRGEINYKRKNGTTFPGEFTSSTFIDADGSTRSSMIIRDVTEQRASQHELAEARERAELYLDLLTHDINNYNSAAMGYLQLAEANLKLDDKEKRLLTRPLEELRNSTLLIASVRDVQKLEMERREAELLDLCTMLEDIKKEYENPPGRDVTISIEESDHCTVMASSLLKEAFSNIVNNAIKHSSGPLIVDIGLKYEVTVAGMYAKISIEDNGPGIDDGIKVKLFNRSARGSTRSAGRGLGLFLVKRLVENLNGKVWVEDRVPGDHTKGARFVVLLPAA